MSDMVRFSTWMSERERRALNRLAHRRQVSVNSVVREAIRVELGWDRLSPELTRATVVTRNNDTKED